MKTETLLYKHEQTELEAYVAYPDNLAASKPTVLIVHPWRGRDEFVCQKAQDMAELGYIGFALDMFGKGVLGNSVEENSALIKPFLDDRNYLKARLLAAFTTLKALASVDVNQIAIIGYCFGGLCALDLARSGADIKGCISVHGILTKPQSLPNQAIKAKILALHGHDDPMVPPAQVQAFQDEMTQAKIDWQMHIYGNTMHAFTNPNANDPKLGTVYNATSDKRATVSIQNFLKEIFGSNHHD